MTQKTKKPEIRFAGFTDEWEQRRLGEVGKACSGVGFPDSEQGGSIGTPFFKVSDMNVSGNENEMTVANNYVTDAQIVSHRWSPIEELPAIFFAKVGAAVMLNRKRLCRFPFLLDNNTMAYSLAKDWWNADFAKALFETVDLTSLVQVGALPSYNAGDVEGMGVWLPKLSEQQQIGTYFKNLNNHLILQQRKVEKLLNVKKSMLEKMFPKAGSRVPEIRFEGFTGDWEQKKLGKLVQFTKGTGYSKSDLKDTGTPIILYGRLYTNYETVITDVDTYADAKINSVYSHGDEVIVPASGETAEDISIASVVENPGVIIGGDLNIIIPPPDLDSAFLAISISNGKPHYDMAKMAQGKSVVHLHNSDLEKIDLFYPSYMEQMQISNFFTSLDRLITLQQRKLEKLQNVKKAMLEKMFV